MDSRAERLEEYLGRYVEGRVVDGAVPDLEELCRDAPELLSDLRELVAEYEAVEGFFEAPSSARLRPGQELLHYRVAGWLGEGGMGQVYLAEDLKLGRQVALKLLPPEMASDAERLRRFQREARAVAALSHPGIVTLYAVEEAAVEGAKGLHFLTMERIRGTTLGERIPADGLDPGEIVDLGGQLVEALAAAHAHGVVHRDLKPGNVMVDADGRVKVLDFGLAKRTADPPSEAETELTADGRIVGTLPYMSPEQVQGQPVDARTDVFALGAILWEMATGRRLFGEKNSAQLISAILSKPVPPLNEHRDDLPAVFDAVVRRCLERDPERRFPSAGAVREAWDALRSAEEAPVPAPRTPSFTLGELRLRVWPPPEWPDLPFPGLHPYSHPDLLAGRDRELRELRELLADVPILGVFARSGTGKSSLLGGGLVPLLRGDGEAVAYDRHPEEGGLAGRLLADLLLADLLLADTVDGVPDHRAFVEGLLAVGRLNGRPPVLVLDQFEALFRRGDEHRRTRAEVGALLAATQQRRSDAAGGVVCRWILAYRQEYHGEVFGWLDDPLRDARAAGLDGVDHLPHDLAGPERFKAWPLAPLGTPPPGSADRRADAEAVFRSVLEKPFESNGERYPWRLSGVERLASAFAEARLAQPQAPLATELQVTLARLLADAEDATAGGPVAVDVPERPSELLDEALEEHLARCLETAFPARDGLERTRALLLLRALADGVAVAGADGDELLEKLVDARLVVLEERGGRRVCALAHDRLADLVVSLVNEGGRYARLGVDVELTALHRFVVLNTELYDAGEVVAATRVPGERFRAVEAHADVLLTDEPRRRWWAACRQRYRAERRRRVALRTAAVLALVLVAGTAGTWTVRRVEEEALAEQVVEGEPEAAFQALDRLAVEHGEDTAWLLALLERRESPTDVLEKGLGAFAEADRAAAVLRAVETALPLVERSPDDTVALANMAWALDFVAARDPPRADAARALRERLLRPLRALRPPPPFHGDDWVDVPGGSFQMGSDPDDVPAGEAAEVRRELPKHVVRLAPFRILRHEVTVEEYRRLVPAAEVPAVLAAVGDGQLGDQPWVGASWWEAYAYAAWLGGRLPTEAEWEYAARAGCGHAYCRRDGSRATREEVAWTRKNALVFERTEPVMGLAANPWGLFDMYGNAAEWVADWFGDYPTAPQEDPWGPTGGTMRVERGGMVWYSPDACRAGYRGRRPPGLNITGGFRVVLGGVD